MGHWIYILFSPPPPRFNTESRLSLWSVSQASESSQAAARSATVYQWSYNWLLNWTAKTSVDILSASDKKNPIKW